MKYTAMGAQLYRAVRSPGRQRAYDICAAAVQAGKFHIPCRIGRRAVEMGMTGTGGQGPGRAGDRRCRQAGLPIDKGKYAVDYICSVNTYDRKASALYEQGDMSLAALEQDVWSSIVTKTTVCAGYASAFQYEVGALGILMSGGGHAWNLLELDGDYYSMGVSGIDGVNGNYVYDWFNFNRDDNLKFQMAVELKPEESLYYPYRLSAKLPSLIISTSARRRMSF